MNALAPFEGLASGLGASFEAATAALAPAAGGPLAALGTLETAFAAAGASLSAALDRLAGDPSLTLAATFFAGSAAGTLSTLVVLSLCWAAVRHLRR